MWANYLDPDSQGILVSLLMTCRNELLVSLSPTWHIGMQSATTSYLLYRVDPHKRWQCNENTMEKNHRRVITAFLIPPVKKASIQWPIPLFWVYHIPIGWEWCCRQTQSYFSQNRLRSFFLPDDENRLCEIVTSVHTVITYVGQAYYCINWTNKSSTTF